VGQNNKKIGLARLELGGELSFSLGPLSAHMTVTAQLTMPSMALASLIIPGLGLCPDWPECGVMQGMCLSGVWKAEGAKNEGSRRDRSHTRARLYSDRLTIRVYAGVQLRMASLVSVWCWGWYWGNLVYPAWWRCTILWCKVCKGEMYLN
jgi:hypothetical protein